MGKSEMSAQLSPMFWSRQTRRSSCPRLRRMACATTGKMIDCNVSTASVACWCLLHPVWQRVAWLNTAITQNTQHSKSRLILHSTALTPGLILSFVLPWFSAKTSPWHSWHVCVPGDWLLLSGEKAVNKIKQKCILAHLRSVVTVIYNRMLRGLADCITIGWDWEAQSSKHSFTNTSLASLYSKIMLDARFFFNKICTQSSFIQIQCLPNWIQTSFTFTKYLMYCSCL